MLIIGLKEFINKAKEVHNDKYDYSLVEYKNNKTKVKIVCPIHGIFEQQPRHHLIYEACKKCKSYKKRQNDFDIFLIKANEVHGERYDYSLVDYKDAETKIKIICKEHGIFEQTPYGHMAGRNCLKCSYKYKNQYKLNTEEFIKRASEVHGNLYDYSKTNYINMGIKIEIDCFIHGTFSIYPNNHIGKKNQTGCPRCNESNGERVIAEYLEENNIEFVREKRFDDCRNKNTLPFDFYIPSRNLCIEYDGELHFMSIECFGGDERLAYQKLNDKIKNQYCKDNSIKLLRIKHNENTLNKLNAYFKIYT